MLQEWDQRRGDRDDLPRRDIHVVQLFRRDLFKALTRAGLNPLLNEESVLVDRRIRLRHDVAVFLVGGEVLHLVGDEGFDVDDREAVERLQTIAHGLRDLLARGRDLTAARSLDILVQNRADDMAVAQPQLPDHAPVRRLDEPEVVDQAEGGQTADQADIRTFRRLDRADAPVVAVVHIAHIESGPIAAETTGAKGAEPALVRQLRQRIGLVHELAQLAAAEKFLHRGDDGADVDQRAGRRLVRVRDRHALAHDPLHAQQADAELVLHQLTDGAHAAVAEVVDIVGAVLAVVDPNLLPDDRDQVMLRERSLFVVGVGQASVELVATNATQVVAARVEEEAVQQPARVLVRRRVTRAQTAIDLQQGPSLGAVLVFGRGRLLGDRAVQEVVQLVGVHVFQHRAHALVGTEQRVVLDLLVGIDRAKQRRDRDLALAVHLDGEDVLRAGLQFQPGTAIGDQLGRAEHAARVGVLRRGEVDTGRAHELTDDDALGAVNHEGAVRRHQWEVAEEELLLLDLATFLDDQLDRHPQRRGEGQIALATVVLGEGWIDLGQQLVEGKVIVDFGSRQVAQTVVAKDQLHAIAREVLDRRDLGEQFVQALLQEPAVGIQLQPDQIGQFLQLRNARVVAFRFWNQHTRDQVGRSRSSGRWGCRRHRETLS